MSDRAKVVLAVTVVVLMVTVIILVNVTKNKEEVPAPDVATITPTQEAPTLTAELTETPIPSPTLAEEISTASPTEELTPTELTEKQKLTIKLLQDPYSLEGEVPIESVTVTAHSEQTANLDRNNMFMLDVSEELDKLGVPYVPLSVTYDSEGEYLTNGYRAWSGYVSDRKSSNGGSAVIYDFDKGTVHTYTYLSNLGKYEDNGTVKTNVTKEKYKPWPKYNFYDMFSEKLPPELKETDTEYIIEGMTTSNGYVRNSETDLFTVTTNPDNGFQYLIKLTIHYDKKTQRVKNFDAEVTGKIKQELYGISNDPTAEKVESDIGLITSTLHVEFFKYNETTLTKLDGKNHVDVDEYNDKKKEDAPVENVYAYTFADGSQYYFTLDEWKMSNRFLSEQDNKGGYRDFLSELKSIKNEFANKYVILENIPTEKRDEWCREDKAWKEALDNLSKRPVNANPMFYELPHFNGYYNTPFIPYLCELLLDEDGRLNKEYTNDTYTGKDYGYLISIVHKEYTDLIGTDFMPMSKLENIFSYNPEEVAKFIWDYRPAEYETMKLEIERGTISLNEKDAETALNLVRNDIRKRFEEKFKSWLIKNNIGSATKPKQ